eukprot:13738740-Alexandrium_andersonii.AAC.1
MRLQDRQTPRKDASAELAFMRRVHAGDAVGLARPPGVGATGPPEARALRPGGGDALLAALLRVGPAHRVGQVFPEDLPAAQ